MLLWILGNMRVLPFRCKSADWFWCGDSLTGFKGFISVASMSSKSNKRNVRCDDKPMIKFYILIREMVDVWMISQW